MKKYNVYYTIQKCEDKPITNRYYWVDAISEQDAIDKANEIGNKKWPLKGYSFKVDYAELSKWFAI
jgi:hypothetical protein